MLNMMKEVTLKLYYYRPSGSENPIINSIYFFGSFIFLIGRTTAVTLLTARINDQCKVILPCLYNCPSVNYCLEVKTFTIFLHARNAFFYTIAYTVSFADRI